MFNPKEESITHYLPCKCIKSNGKCKPDVDGIISVYGSIVRTLDNDLDNRFIDEQEYDFRIKEALSTYIKVMDGIFVETCYSEYEGVANF